MARMGQMVRGGKMNVGEWNKSTHEEKERHKSHIDRKIKRQRQIIAGDLVRIGPWCKNKFRLAHVVAVTEWDTRNIMIQYLDELGLGEKPSRALSDNLELVLPEGQSLEDRDLPKQEFRNHRRARNTRGDPYLPYHRRG